MNGNKRKTNRNTWEDKVKVEEKIRNTDKRKKKTGMRENT